MMLGQKTSAPAESRRSTFGEMPLLAAICYLLALACVVGALAWGAAWLFFQEPVFVEAAGCLGGALFWWIVGALVHGIWRDRSP
jgi:hypothetical protein